MQTTPASNVKEDTIYVIFSLILLTLLIIDPSKLETSSTAFLAPIFMYRSYIISTLFLAVIITATTTNRRQIFILNRYITYILIVSFVSTLWSTVPYQTLTGAFTLLVIVTIINGAIESTSYHHYMRWLYSFLAVSIIVNICYVYFGSAGTHPIGDPDGHDGAWRGLFTHKNVAARFYTLYLALLVAKIVRKLTLIDLLLISLTSFFILNSDSSTGVIVSSIILILGGIKFSIRTQAGATIVFFFAAISSITALVFFLSNLSELIQLFQDPASFTGRVSLWQILWTNFSKKLLLGYGYNGFWTQDLIYFLIPYSDFYSTISQSHNGYLDVFLQFGFFIGGSIIYVFTIVPLYYCFKFKENSFSIFLVVLAFAIINFLETELLRSLSPTWALFLMILIGNKVYSKPVVSG